jgi:hypothetical protein
LGSFFVAMFDSLKDTCTIFAVAENQQGDAYAFSFA